MARPVGKNASTKYVVVVSCVGLLAAALMADFLWASSSSSYLSTVSSWAVDKAHPMVIPRFEKKEASKSKKDLKLGGPNATFADIPAPMLEWEEMASAPVPRLDGAAIQIKNLLYVFAGYGTIDYVHSHVDIYNFTDNSWGGRFDMPKDMAHSHLGMVTDGRYIYVVTGQYGPQCRGPTSRSFVLDTEKKQWSDLPSLPVPRYAPATQLWRGRLHVMGGSKEDRHEPGLEHWSIAVKDGKVLEETWRSEVPIPRGGPHRACVVVNDRLYAIGGQEGDFMAKPGSPIFKCTRRHEVYWRRNFINAPIPNSSVEGYHIADKDNYYICKSNGHIVIKVAYNWKLLMVVFSDVYMLDDEMKWKQMPPMPKPDSHIEFAWVIVNNSIIIVGGTTDKHPVTKKMILTGEVFRFRLDTLEWSVVGKMPFRVKTTLVGFWDGYLYFTSGQRDRGPHDPSPKKVIASMWRTKLIL